MQKPKNFTLPTESRWIFGFLRGMEKYSKTLRVRLIEGGAKANVYAILSRSRSSPPYVNFSRERGRARAGPSARTEGARHGTGLRWNGGEDLSRIHGDSGGHGLQKLSLFRVRLQHASGQHAMPRSAGCPEGFLPPLTHWTRHLCMSSLV